MAIKKIIALFLLAALLGCATTRQPDPAERLRADQLIDQGVLLLRSAQLKQAQSAFELSLELSSSAAAVDGLGCIALIEGHYAAAEALFHRAYALDPDYTNALANLALLYDISGFETEAHEAYLRAIAGDPENYMVRNNFAAFQNDYTSTEDSAGSAIVELRKAIILADHPLIKSNMEQLVEE